MEFVIDGNTPVFVAFALTDFDHLILKIHISEGEMTKLTRSYLYPPKRKDDPNPLELESPLYSFLSPAPHQLNKLS
jgi:hypothetical protein